MYNDTAIVTPTRLTTITCMRTFCSILPVGSRSRLRSYNEPFSTPNWQSSSPLLLPPPSTVVHVSHNTILVKPQVGVDRTENSWLTVPAQLPCIVAKHVNSKVACARNICLKVDLLSRLAISHSLHKHKKKDYEYERHNHIITIIAEVNACKFP